MITREHLRLDLAIRYSWKVLLFSAICWTIAFVTYRLEGIPRLVVPTPVVAILGTALAIILGFRNSSAYERWWEARKIWGGIVNESRSFTRQVLTLPAARTSAGAEPDGKQLVYHHLAWVNALKLQLRERKEPELWSREVERYLEPGVRTRVLASANRVTRIGHEQGIAIRELLNTGALDTVLCAQLDETLTRLTDLQGRAERIKNTPLPRHYDYYTLAFLDLFVIFFPFGMLDLAGSLATQLLLLPVGMVVSWIFYQIYIFGKVQASPFANWTTDVALNAICTTIEIDLKQLLGDPDVPEPARPVDGVLM
jgi:ion channel-forming bestrophin family protein